MQNKTSLEVNDIWNANKERILDECLLVSSVPGKALRMLVDIVRLAERFKTRFQSQAG